MVDPLITKIKCVEFETFSTNYLSQVNSSTLTDGLADEKPMKHEQCFIPIEYECDAFKILKTYQIDSMDNG